MCALAGQRPAPAQRSDGSGCGRRRCRTTAHIHRLKGGWVRPWLAVSRARWPPSLPLPGTNALALAIAPLSHSSHTHIHAHMHTHAARTHVACMLFSLCPLFPRNVAHPPNTLARCCAGVPVRYAVRAHCPAGPTPLHAGPGSRPAADGGLRAQGGYQVGGSCWAVPCRAVLCRHPPPSG